MTQEERAALVKQLRDDELVTLNTVAKAADQIEADGHRIAELEAALRNIIEDCEADYPPSHGAIKYAARAALGDKG